MVAQGLPADKMGIKYSLLADFHPKGAMSEKVRRIPRLTKESPAAPSPL